MAIVVKTRTYNTGDNLTASYYNQDRDEIIAGVNSVVDAQVAISAGIQESKILFSGTSGHGHTGSTDGKKIVLASSMDLTGLTAGMYLRVNSGGTAIESVAVGTGTTRSFVFYVGTDPLVVGTDLAHNPRVQSNITVTRISARVKTAPTGQSLIMTVQKIGGATIGTVTILAGATTGFTTTITTPSLVAGDELQFNITQVGSVIAGSKVTVTMDCVV